jgi:hypothetical protein
MLCNPFGTHGVEKTFGLQNFHSQQILKHFLEIIPAIRRTVQSVDSSHLSYLGDPVLVLVAQTGYLLEFFSGFFSVLPVE